jgi:hypothetical protein
MASRLRSRHSTCERYKVAVVNKWSKTMNEVPRFYSGRSRMVVCVNIFRTFKWEAYPTTQLTIV